jgi:hypothetical protein
VTPEQDQSVERGVLDDDGAAFEVVAVELLVALNCVATISSPT